MKNITKLTILGCVLVIFIFAISCKQFREKYFGISEGEIIYQVKFPNIKSGSLAASMMPNEVHAYFKNTKLRVEMNIAYGLVRTISISDGKDEKEAILMDLFGKKWLFMNDAGLIARENKIHYQFEKLNEKKQIAGLDCNRVVVINPENKKSFSIYYTNAIRTKNINWHTPYRDIEGMLLEYPISRNHIDMELVAANIEKKNLSDSLFIIPPGYETINKQSFDSILNVLMVSAGIDQ